MHSKVLLALSFAAPMVAQTVRTIGPSQTYPDIASAIAAASPGDILHVTAGTYGVFTLDRGVTVRAEPIGAAVLVAGSSFLDTCLFEVPAGQTATIEGLDLQTIALVRPPSGTATAGAVAFTGTDVEWGVTVQDANAVLRNCVVNGFGTALELTGASTATAVQCTFQGRQASWVPSPCGLRASGTSTLQLGSCLVRGGTNGFHGITSVGNGALLSGAARCWFVDTDVAAWNQNVVPCAAVVNTSTVPVVFERGSALDNLGNPNSFQGAAQNDLVLGASSTDQIQIGMPFTIDYRTRPGLPVFVHAMFQLQAPVAIPILAQADWGFVPNSIFLGGILADPQGLAPFSVLIPNLPLLQDMQLWFCAWSATSLPVQLAPVLGGTIR